VPAAPRKAGRARDAHTHPSHIQGLEGRNRTCPASEAPQRLCLRGRVIDRTRKGATRSTQFISQVESRKCLQEAPRVAQMLVRTRGPSRAVTALQEEDVLLYTGFDRRRDAALARRDA